MNRENPYTPSVSTLVGTGTSKWLTRYQLCALTFSAIVLLSALNESYAYIQAVHASNNLTVLQYAWPSALAHVYLMVTAGLLLVVEFRGRGARLLPVILAVPLLFSLWLVVASIVSILTSSAIEAMVQILQRPSQLLPLLMALIVWYYAWACLSRFRSKRQQENGEPDDARESPS